MHTKIAFKELYYNFKEFFSLILFMVIMIAISIVLVTISSLLPSKLKNMTNANCWIVFFDKVESNELKLNDYCIFSNDLICSTSLDNGLCEISEPVIFSNEKDFKDDTLYITEDVFQELGDFTDLTLIIHYKNEDRVIKYDFYSYEIIESDIDGVFLSDYYFNIFSGTDMGIAVNIRNYNDLDMLSKYAKARGLNQKQIESYGLLDLYMSIKSTQVFLLAVTCFIVIFITVSTYISMKSYFEKRSIYFGILKVYGFNNKDIYLVYFLVFSLLFIISTILSLALVFPILYYINKTGLDIFKVKFDFKTSWYYFFAFCILLILLYTVVFSKKVFTLIKKLELIDILKGDE